MSTTLEQYLRAIQGAYEKRLDPQRMFIDNLLECLKNEEQRENDLLRLDVASGPGCDSTGVIQAALVFVSLVQKAFSDQHLELAKTTAHTIAVFYYG